MRVDAPGLLRWQLARRVQRFVHRRRAVLRLGPEQRQVTPLARPASSIVSRHVRRHDEEPPPGVLRLVYQCSGERLLRQVLRALDVPHLAVQEPHERAVRGAIGLRQVLARHTAQERKSRTSAASSPSVHPVLPPDSILMLTRRPATSTPGANAAGFTSSGRDRKSTRLNSSHLVISYAVFCLKKKKKNKLLTMMKMH